MRAEKNMTIPDFLHLVRRRALAILLTMLICGALALAVTLWILPVRYTASTTFCVRNRTGYEDGITSADIAACESLTEPCIALISGAETMALAAQDFDGITEVELLSVLSFEDMGAGVFRMSVTDGSAGRAQAIAARICEVSVGRIPASLNAGTLSVIDDVTVTKNTPPAARGLFIGFLAGAAVSVLAVLLWDNRGSRKSRGEKERNELI